MKRFVVVKETSGIIKKTTFSYRYFDTGVEAWGLIDRNRKRDEKSVLTRRYIVDRKTQPHVYLPGAAPYSG